MKKFLNKFLILILICSIFLLSGCESTSNYKVVTCSRSATLSDSNTTADLNYEIYYEDDYVKKTVSTETITSSSSDVLKSYKTSYESVFEKYKDINHYNNTVTTNANSVISKTTIDYTKVDYKKIIAIEGEKGNIFTKKGKVKLQTLIDTYEKYGSECDN